MYIDEKDIIGDDLITDIKEVKDEVVATFKINFNRLVELSITKLDGVEYLKITRVSKKKRKSFYLEKIFIGELVKALNSIQI